MIKIELKKFEDLSTSQLYDLLQLRSEVFVVEQNCAYQDLDGKDQVAFHVLAYKESKLVGCTRLFKAGDCYKESSIGRVLVKNNQRAFGYGHQLIKFSIATIKENFNTSVIKIGAQSYLKKFYESHGFEQVGDEYLEDKIPHIKMIRNQDNIYKMKKGLH